MRLIFCTVTACYQHNVSVLQRRQGTVRFKTKAGGEQSREALLETKTHRRVNRRQVSSQCFCALCKVWHKKPAFSEIDHLCDPIAWSCPLMTSCAARIKCNGARANTAILTRRLVLFTLLHLMFVSITLICVVADQARDAGPHRQS